MPNARIGVLYQNDDYGKDYLKGLKDALGDAAAKLIVAEVTYEVTDPTIDSQIVSLQASGADVFYDVTTPKFAAQAIRKTYDIGWKPVHMLNSVSSSVAAVMTPAGLEKGVGVVSLAYYKDPTDPQWKDDAAFKQWVAWMDKYYPDGDKADAFNVYAYNLAMTMVQVLKQCGNELTRENIMKQAANLDLDLPMFLPGVKVGTTPTQFFPVREMQLTKFDGKIFERFGEVIKTE
jgi:branched-chain amino acid transport system substrate-binding protein